MSEQQYDVVRAWKDETYRNSLPEDVRAKMPAPPEGADKMTDEQLAEVAGASPLVAASVTAASVTTAALASATVGYETA